jgi:pilus assembly protein CpaE
MSSPAVLILGADKEAELGFRRALADVAQITCAVGAPDKVQDEYRALGAQVVVVVAGPNREGAFAQIGALSQLGARVVVVGPSKDPDLILAAMRAGAREFVVASDAAELVRAVVAQARPTDSAAGGSLITVFPTRGGVGATTLGVNLAAALARRGGKICLVDFDLYLGDVLSFLDLPGTYSITDVISNMGRLDADLLDTSVNRHSSGVRVLAQSGKVEEAESVAPADVVNMLDFLRRHYSHLVIDGIAGFDELSLAVLDASQQIVMVLTQDVPSVRSAKRCLDLFRRLGYDDRKIRLVLNRHQRSSKLTPQVISDAVGMPVAHTVSNDFGSAIESINRGMVLQDLAPRSPLTRDIEALAPAIAGEAKGDSKSDDQKGGFLRGLWSRKGSGGSPRAA